MTEVVTLDRAIELLITLRAQHGGDTILCVGRESSSCDLMESAVTGFVVHTGPSGRVSVVVQPEQEEFDFSI